MDINKDMKVLIVDDHKTMLRIVRNLLSQINISNVDEATDGQAALQKLAHNKYDLVLSDWNMMPMTGLQLLQFVRTDSTYEHKNVPFIMITAESRPENVMEAKQAGVDNYIIKPFNADTLETKIKSVMTKKQR
ncbi:response regulator [Micavibrio aeruginosavorus]|uniref:response regulator n=1 Tax=Micavibrio aeruginosavorus TaxID=349221 RepID=UPI0005A0658B|nr:response regulator [Micavibrio aeruginosavorus]